MNLLPLRLSRFAVLAGAAACLVPTGCATHVYGPPPPPPPYAASALIQEADNRGFREGADDDARDTLNGSGYHPRRDRKFSEAPGYDPALGPFPPYRDAFRAAYLRGYSDGFNHR